MTIMLAMAYVLGLLIGAGLMIGALIAVAVVHPVLAWTFLAIAVAAKLWPV